ncbi:DnaB-like helicase C-terminal domain-containing protein [Rhizobium leguminosarum]|uniref:DnaB-like helicase C-terminal domain-containing protein n=1 Tax=Rhizobium leguminosarum TaxID=384 RepID=UPI00048574C4|nr:DnaB-like helicase C-terminal domain-containing protein [Rhizobium leguminosarum]
MSDEESTSEFIEHIACEDCGSSDANSLYSDGHTHCFACGKTKAGDGPRDSSARSSKPTPREFVDGRAVSLPSRKLSEETCRRIGLKVGKLGDGRWVRIIPVFKKGVQTGQKIKPEDKDETFAVGETTKSELFMQHLFKGAGKMLIITEGEEDAASVYQAMGYKWPVVSVTKGADGAKDDIKRNLDFVNSYDKVVFMFDMDAPGREACEDCAPLLTPGKAHIAHLPRKDANECLVAGDVQSIITAAWEAKVWRPDGVFTLSEIFEEACKPVEHGLPWCFPTMTQWTFGRRPGELIGFGAGTGVGKTDLFTQQIEYDINTLEEQVGIIFLEQHRSETANRLAGKMASKPFHVPDGSWNDDERISAIRKLADTGRVNLYSSFGVADWDRVKVIIRSMAVQQGARLIYLDHLTALADPSNERESLEIIMAELASMAQELGVVIHYISHLSTPEGKSHEEGGRVLLKHFKGSRAIGFWTFFAFGLERDKGAEDPADRCILTIRCVKDRLTGRADGCTLRVRYDQKTTRLTECTPFDDIETEDFKAEAEEAFTPF